MRIYVQHNHNRMVFDSEASLAQARARGDFPDTAVYWRAGMEGWAPVTTMPLPVEMVGPDKVLVPRPLTFLPHLTAAWPLLLALPWGWTGAWVGGLAYALGLLISRMPLPATAKAVGTMLSGLAAFVICGMLSANQEMAARDDADLVRGVKWGDQFNGDLKVQSISWGNVEDSLPTQPAPRPTPIINPADHRLDSDSNGWPDLWPQHWREDGFAIDLSQITDSHLAEVYAVMMQSRGAPGETPRERLMRIGRYSAGRNPLQQGITRLPTAEIVPVDNHWLTLGAAQVASEQLRAIAGIESIVLPSLDMRLRPYSDKKVKASVLLSDCLDKSPSKTKTLRFFVTGARAILPERGYENFIFYHGDSSKDKASVLLPIWALRPQTSEVGGLPSQTNRSLWAKLTGIRLARNMIAPICYMLDLPISADPKCLSNMGDSVEAMDALDPLPSGTFLARLDRWETANTPSPEGVTAPAEVATMMIRDAWRNAARGKMGVLHTLTRGDVEITPVWKEINYAVSPNPIPGSLREEQMSFSILCKNGRQATVTYTWFLGMPHTLFYDPEPSSTSY